MDYAEATSLGKQIILDALRKAMREKGCTPKRLASITKLHIDTVVDILCGKTNPMISDCVKFAEALGAKFVVEFVSTTDSTNGDRVLKVGKGYKIIETKNNEYKVINTEDDGIPF